MGKETKKSFTDAITQKQVIGLIVSIIVYIVIRLLPLASTGLEPAGQKALAALMWMVVVLITNCLSTMLSTLIFAALIILTGVMNQGALFTAFGTSPFLLVLGLGIVAVGMTKTNLGARIAFGLMKTIGRTPALLLLAVMLTGGILSAFIANLPALLAVCPIIVSVLHTLHEQPETSKLGKAMFIGLIWAGGAGGLCFISSAATNAAGVGAVSAATDGAINISFSQFATMGIPTGIIMLLSGWVFLSLWFGLFRKENVLNKELLESEHEKLGKIEAVEIRYTIYLIAMVVCFFLGGNYGIMPPTVGLVFAALCMCPVIGVISAQDAMKGQNWAMMFQIGFFVGFAGAISSTGLGDWLATVLFGGLNVANPFVLLLIVTCLGHIVNFLVPGGGAGLVVMPAVMALSSMAGIETAYLGLMMVFVVAWSQLMPVQPQYLVVQGNTGGYLQVKDYVLPNIIITIVWTILLVPAYYLLAPLAGLL
jgi:sodium-dependent dicarboxylate transporter 2/3/5